MVYMSLYVNIAPIIIRAAKIIKNTAKILFKVKKEDFLENSNKFSPPQRKAEAKKILIINKIKSPEKPVAKL